MSLLAVRCPRLECPLVNDSTKKALRSLPIGKPMILQQLSGAKKPSATKSCLVVIGISFMISIYIHTMSINTSPQNSRNKFLIIHETWHKTWPLQIHRSVLICISEVDDVISW